MWMENDQANTLATGDVSKYALAVNWAQLKGQGKDARTAADRLLQPLVRLTAVVSAKGVKDAEGTNTYTGPTYLGRVQPYAVYVPNHLQPLEADPADLDPALARCQPPTSTGGWLRAS